MERNMLRVSIRHNTFCPSTASFAVKYHFVKNRGLKFRVILSHSGELFVFPSPHVSFLFSPLHFLLSFIEQRHRQS